MSDDFGTVNSRGGESARELEVLKRRYREHRDTLTRLAAGAPTAHLAGEYGRIVRDIDNAVARLDELDRDDLSPAETPPPSAPPKPARSTGFQSDPPTRDPGFSSRPLILGPEGEDEAEGSFQTPSREAGLPGRPLLIVVAGLIVVAFIGWLVWRASRDRGDTRAAVAESPIATETTRPLTESAPPRATPPPPVAAALVITPASADFGTIRKGTRAVRQFEVTNSTAAPIEYQVTRSQCRCLYYEYKGKVAAKQKETLTVTVDGAKVKGSPLHETVTVHGKSDPAVSASFDVDAVIH